ncbi:hypothetical protein B0A49_03316 [Cryomyces minteri]|uniref:polynucleotide adenylyltransferase n=1 Tax=Cryomyces minteri TaxID=331657 RepID=A0A4V5NGW7_9PEZI|nr:hypothetical protein B0A49_03316 [Cryomyces minteri]
MILGNVKIQQEPLQTRGPRPQGHPRTRHSNNNSAAKGPEKAINEPRVPASATGIPSGTGNRNPGYQAWRATAVAPSTAGLSGPHPGRHPNAPQAGRGSTLGNDQSGITFLQRPRTGGVHGPQGFNAQTLAANMVQSQPANRSWRPQTQYQRPGPPPAMQAFNAQCQFLEETAAIEIPKVEMTSEEFAAKEAFRLSLVSVCRDVCAGEDSGFFPRVTLQSFGSLRSGFANAGSDMDLAIVSSTPQSSPHVFSLHELDLPRLLEKRFLELGFGARLLTRTRVPIIKVCQEPTLELLSALREEREKWDALPDGEKYPKPKPVVEDKLVEEGTKTASDNTPACTVNDQKLNATKPSPSESQDSASRSLANEKQPQVLSTTLAQTALRPRRQEESLKPWLREKKLGPLDFPKTGVGIQCDINFSNALALHNTLLLRCYSACDPRVRPMVLFIKSWAKRRKINSSYSGTLSSYGYVLMILHFLANVAQPPVTPNLQLAWQPPTEHSPPQASTDEISCDGYDVRFWRDEAELRRMAMEGRGSQNHEPLGALLRNFFHYFAQQGNGVAGFGFNWTQDVLSLRTQGGLIPKRVKGWTGAKSQILDGKEIRHRYLFAIEDPFEHEHNVARTVTHMGICAIRDEFRRAWRILCAVGQGMEARDGGLFDVVLPPPEPSAEEKKDGEDRKDGPDLSDTVLFPSLNGNVAAADRVVG